MNSFKMLCKRLYLFLFVLLWCCASVLNAAASVKIQGKVLDKTTGEGLPGANIYIKDTSLGTSTNLKGEYSLSLPVGPYTVVVSFIGYHTVEEPLLLTTTDRPVERTFELEYTIVEGETVTITAQASGQLGAINQQIRSTTIKNVVAADKIKEVPDANAAESIGRLPGIAIQRKNGEGDKVIVRGLSPQYSTISIDGVKIPPDYAEDRSVGLSFISAEMLEGIEVTKSLTADMDADVLGGNVNLIMKEAKPGFHYSAKATGGYNGLAEEFKDYQLSGTIGNRFFNNALGLLLTGNTERLNRSSDNFGAWYSGTPVNAGVDSVTGETIYNMYTEGAHLTEHVGTVKRNGGALMLDFKIGNYQLKFNNVFNKQFSNSIDRKNQFEFGGGEAFKLFVDEEDWDKTVRTHSLSNHLEAFGSEFDLVISNAYVENNGRNFGHDYFDRQAIENISDFRESEKLFRQPKDLIQKVIIDSVGQGYFAGLNFGDEKITDDNWIYKADIKTPFRLGNWAAGHLKYGAKYERKDRESNRDSRSAGVRYGGNSHRRRKIESLFPDLLTAGELDNYPDDPGLPVISFLDPDYDYGDFLNGRYDLGWTVDIDFARQVHEAFLASETEDQIYYFFSGTDSYNRDYDVTEEMTAAYVMSELNLFNDRLSLVPGVRWEKENTEYSAFKIITANAPTGIQFVQDTTVTRENINWFPSLNLKFKLNQNSHLQGAMYRSVTRPNFTHLSPGFIVPIGSDDLRINNPQIRPATAWNYDLGYSFYNNYVGLFSINGFYKVIDGLTSSLQYEPLSMDLILPGLPQDIYDELVGPDFIQQFNKGGRSRFVTTMPFNSLYQASIKGVELSMQTNFWYLPGLLRGIVLDFNLTLLESSRKYDYLNIVTVPVDTIFGAPVYKQFYEYDTRRAKLEDQPEVIYNIRVGYEIGGFSSHLSFRYQANTINSVSTQWSQHDRYVQDMFRIDFALKQKITDHIAFFANGQNLNNYIDDETQKVAPGLRLPSWSQFYGRTFQAGFMIDF